MADFVHLHLHSHYSLLDGAGKIPDILARVKELGMESIALTDHGAMYGIIDFYEQAKALGVKPILGVEGYVAPRSRLDKTPHIDNKPYHIILLAESFEGYKNLLKIVSDAHLQGYYYKPRTDKPFLADHAQGLIATSGCHNGEIARKLLLSYQEGARALEEYLKIFGENNFFLEIQRHPEFSKDPQYANEMKHVNELLIKLANEFKTPLVASCDVHYINKDDDEAQDVLVCVASGKMVADSHRLDYRGYNLSIRSPQEMTELYPDLPDALSNTVKIAERCQVELPMDTYILPNFPVPDNQTPRQYLRKLCYEGLKKRFGFEYKPDQNWTDGEILSAPITTSDESLEKTAIKRMEYELSVIEKMGFETYFLITSDFITWAKNQNIIIGPGRGSAAGSIVSFLTEITDIDPLKYNLIFERFLNPDRISMPDIDTDIMDARRDEVIEYVRQKYGPDHVAQIITFGTMLARNAVRDVGRVLGFAYQECDYLAKLIPFGATLKEAIYSVEELKQIYQTNERSKKLLDLAQKLEGVARHTSVHAAGVVISKEPLTEYLPIQYAAKDDKAVTTQYAMNQVDHIGLLKMDFLGLANLNIIQKATEIIEAIHHLKINFQTLETDDQKTYQLLARAETTGVFQLESSGIKRYLKQLKPTEFEDIISMVALYRPGPMESIPDFIDSKHGRKAIAYLDPILEPILKKTYGVIVTQDQVLQIARDFAGFSYGEADVLRKAVGKKIKKLLDEQREKFIESAIEKKKIPADTAQKVWDFIEPFARYGFNRAHAACYAMISYQTAYLKAHFPVEFMAALMTSDLNNLDRIAIEISECADLGVLVLPPEVNESFVDFGLIQKNADSGVETTRRVVSNQELRRPTEASLPNSECHCQEIAYIRFGLAAIKNVGEEVAKKIVRDRKDHGPFKDFTDFLVRLGTNCLNKKVLEALAMSGALDSLSERNLILANLDKILDFIQSVSRQVNNNQDNLFGDSLAQTTIYTLTLAPTSPAEVKVRLAWEKELLGIYLSDHPLKFLKNLMPKNASKIKEIKPEQNNQAVRIAGMITKQRVILTKNNQSMSFVGVEDETGQIEVIVFPKVYEQYKELWQDGKAVVIDGTISSKDNRSGKDSLEAKILVNYVWELIEDPKNQIPAFEPKSSRRLSNSNYPAAKSVETGYKPVSSQNEPLSSPLIITIPENSTRDLLIQLKNVFSANPGETQVILKIQKNGDWQEVPTKARVQFNGIISHRLNELIGKENYRI